jgi:uncharacterized protein
MTQRRVARLAGLAGAGATMAAGGALLAAAVVFARRVVTPEAPPGHRDEDIEVLGVGPASVTLLATAETTAPGRYGLWLDSGAGHARLGEVLDHDEVAGTVTRRLLGVDRGRLREGPARWNQYFYAGTPIQALDLPFQQIDIAGETGPLPAWLVPPSDEVPRRDTWAILVHGRGATREECLRAVPVLHRLGFASLVVSYRNDHDLPPSGSGRYHLGESEWRDLEAAVLVAVSHGAVDVVLVGWSMGGALALQHLSRSWTADRVRALVLNAPVIDWRDVFGHHARRNGVPVPVSRLAQGLLGHGQARRLVSLQTAVPLDRFDWVARAAELRVPVLLLHSDDDEYVPSGPSHALAQARPDLVTHVPSKHARHTKEWNVDPEQWETAVARFLLGL